MLMWTGSHVLEPVVVAAVTGGGEEVCFLVGLHVVVGGRGRWSLVHLLLLVICVGREVEEARWGTT